MLHRYSGIGLDHGYLVSAFAPHVINGRADIDRNRYFGTVRHGLVIRIIGPYGGLVYQQVHRAGL